MNAMLSTFGLLHFPVILMSNIRISCLLSNYSSINHVSFVILLLCHMPSHLIIQYKSPCPLTCLGFCPLSSNISDLSRQL